MSRLKSPLLTFRCGDEHFALDGTVVVEVATALETIRVPGTRPWFLGLANLRGQIVHVLDASRWLQIDPPATTERCTIIIEYDQTLYGLMVNEVLDLIADEEVVEHPVPQSLSAVIRKSLKSVIEWDDQLYLLINSTHLFSSVMLAAGDVTDPVLEPAG